MKLIDNFKNLFKRSPVKQVEETVTTSCLACNGKKTIVNPFVNQYNYQDKSIIQNITCWFCNGDGHRTYTGIQGYIAMKKEYMRKYYNVWKHSRLLFSGARLVNNGKEIRG